MLVEHLKKILNIEDNTLAYEEARKKLCDTYMILNGQLVYLVTIGDSAIEYYDITQTSKIIEQEKIDSLVSWLPDSGVYISEGMPIVLRKEPRRQWRKSMSLQFYKHKGIVNDTYDQDYRVPFLIFGQREGQSLCFHNGFVYFLDKRIASYRADLNGGSIKIRNELFRQEIIDYTKGTMWRIIN